MPGYKDWIDAIDIKVDYFSAFMKAWIAFNAWYKNSGEVKGKTDKDCIEYIANKENRFKTYIGNLLLSKDQDGTAFRESLSSLHNTLLNAAIKTQEYTGVQQTISFNEIAVKNGHNHDFFNHRNVKYDCLRTQDKVTTVITIIKSSTEILRYEQAEYDLEDLKQQSQFLQLSEERKRKCIESYAKIKPYVISSVIATNNNKIDIGIYSFVNDTSQISQAIIIILYMLRCCLAHGNVSPDETANKAYRYAYEVLVPPLKKLK